MKHFGLNSQDNKVFSSIGLKMIIEKSATNFAVIISEAVIFNNNDCYKFSGIIEIKTIKPINVN
ncbi:MAG: hypothetical protein ACRCZW_07185 [Lactobacillaceae bacterium]